MAHTKRITGACSGRYLASPNVSATEGTGWVRSRASGEGRFQQVVVADEHRLLCDEPESLGGQGSGPSPYDLLSAALVACTSMTFQLYADRKGWVLPPFTVKVRHAKVHAKDCAACVEGGSGMIDRFERQIAFDLDPGEEVRAKALEIAEKCPVHRTLASRSAIVTELRSEPSSLT